MWMGMGGDSRAYDFDLWKWQFARLEWKEDWMDSTIACELLGGGILYLNLFNINNLGPPNSFDPHLAIQWSNCRRICVKSKDGSCPLAWCGGTERGMYLYSLFGLGSGEPKNGMGGWWVAAADWMKGGGDIGEWTGDSIERRGMSEQFYGTFR